MFRNSSYAITSGRLDTGTTVRAALHNPSHSQQATVFASVLGRWNGFSQFILFINIFIFLAGFFTGC